jgi:3-dehydroquinate synthase/2-deoxy-scyllo-inosose synthase
VLERIISLGSQTVPYHFGADCAEEIGKLVAAEAPAARSALLVADRMAGDHADEVARSLAAADLEVDVLLLDAREQVKSLSAVESVLEHAVDRGLTRSSVLLGMGGGLVGNVTGLAASLLYRGIRFVHLPTTPVAAFDSVLSVKQAVNLSSGKNLCGTYFTPTLIACDLVWLTTVERRDLFNSLAEMVKNVLTVVPHEDAALARVIEQLRTTVTTESLMDLLRIGIEAKAPHLQADPRERKEALVFEYGHTAGHALEFASAGSMRHGEAVAWGMLAAAEVSRSLGHLDEGDVDRHYTAVHRLGVRALAEKLAGMDPDRLRRAMSVDNKRGYIRGAAGEIPMVLLGSVGSPLTGPDGYPLISVPLEHLMAALARVAARTGEW